MNKVKVIGPREPKDKRAINTTSSCKGPGRSFSPFFLGPVKLYDGMVAQNVENGWQYSKVYKCFLDKNNEPKPEYFNWARSGWDNPRAVRYPMGKGAKPAYSYWDGEKLDYISARKKIYFPLYANAVIKTKAFEVLKKQYNDGAQIILWDFDGYDHLSMGMSLKDVLNNPERPMGHAFVIAALLEETFNKK